MGNDSRLQNSSDVAYRQQGVPSLRLDQLNQGGSQGRQTNVDRLNVTHLYEANNQKLLQLNQLSNNPEDMASQDQLDQLLVNFLNHQIQHQQRKGWKKIKELDNLKNNSNSRSEKHRREQRN